MGERLIRLQQLAGGKGTIPWYCARRTLLHMLARQARGVRSAALYLTCPHYFALCLTLSHAFSLLSTLLPALYPLCDPHAFSLCRTPFPSQSCMASGM
eukprot:3483926-Rhodomonas_salina.1